MTHSPHSLPAGATLVVMGVSGSGKTTVAGLLAQHLGRPMLEGDEMHTEQAKEKMGAGHPLTDADRWPWLRRIRDWIRARAASGGAGIVACSALKRSYRELLAGRTGTDSDGAPGAPPVVFVYLDVGRAELHRRLSERTGHYMKADMLDSQLDALEPPDSTAEAALTVDATGAPEDIADAVLRQLP